MKRFLYRLLFTYIHTYSALKNGKCALLVVRYTEAYESLKSVVKFISCRFFFIGKKWAGQTFGRPGTVLTWCAAERRIHWTVKSLRVFLLRISSCSFRMWKWFQSERRREGKRRRNLNCGVCEFYFIFFFSLDRVACNGLLLLLGCGLTSSGQRWRRCRALALTLTLKPPKTTLPRPSPSAAGDVMVTFRMERNNLQFPRLSGL